jgi:hypothetical protein
LFTSVVVIDKVFLLAFEWPPCYEAGTFKKVWDNKESGLWDFSRINNRGRSLGVYAKKRLYTSRSISRNAQWVSISFHEKKGYPITARFNEREPGVDCARGKDLAAFGVSRISMESKTLFSSKGVEQLNTKYRKAPSGYAQLQKNVRGCGLKSWKGYEKQPSLTFKKVNLN